MKNKVVVVTGAAGVICSMIAKHFAKLGAKVAMLDLNYEKAKEHLHQKCSQKCHILKNHTFIS